MERLEKPKSLDEQAYFHIKSAILKCSLKPGEFLAEVRVAEDFGISKTPIRKAMARLQQEGFLTNIPYKGYFVAEISIKDIVEVYELRQLLECYLVRETTPLFSQAELDEMDTTIREAQQAADGGDFGHYVALNREFHHAFDRKYGHHRISDVLTNLDEHVQRILFYTLHKHNDLLSKVDHQSILEAVRDRDVDLAEQRMREHLAEFCDDLVNRMNQS